jgi:hypothetical protein
VADAASLDAATAITLAAWVLPERTGTQYIIKKARSNLVDGYELGLSDTGLAFVRFNQGSWGDRYQLTSSSGYPTDGNTWVHLAATFDGQTIELYVNGVLEGSLAAPGLVLGSNDLDLSIGAEDNGSKSLQGTLDDVQVFRVGLTGQQVRWLVVGQPPDLDAWVTGELIPTAASATTGDKPQAKVWRYADQWWVVYPDDTGSWIRRLDGDAWTDVQLLSADTETHADYALAEGGRVVHILLEDDAQTQLVSLEYVPGTPGAYQPWSGRPQAVDIPLDSWTDTATIAIDSSGRMWLAYDAYNTIEVRYSDLSSGYAVWSGPITIASGIADDDICAVVAYAGQVGVLWSNQNSKRFGFRSHVDWLHASTWEGAEVPASQSAVNVGRGMADDHVNLAAASDGTVYAAVKTEYDTAGLPMVALLVRRPSGSWDELYPVASHGTRPIVVLNEVVGSLMVVYTESNSGGDIRYKTSATSRIEFGSSKTLMAGSDLNNASSTKQNFETDLVVISTGGSIGNLYVEGVHFEAP